MLAIVFAFGANIAFAEVEWSGDISPTYPPFFWSSTTSVVVGRSSVGMLSVDDATNLASRNIALGDFIGSAGEVSNGGEGSSWTNSGWLKIGNDGSGMLTISNGATAQVAQETWLAAGADSTGPLNHVRPGKCPELY